MKVVYIAGPYRSSIGEWGVLQNIRAAETLALKVWKMGAACICPHKNTAFFGGAALDEVWLQGDLEILRRCDAVLCTYNWRDSKGASMEVVRAGELGIPVFDNISDLETWLINKAHMEGL